MTYEPYHGDAIPILESFRDFYEPQLSAETLRRYLAAPIAIRDREEKEEQLSKIARPDVIGSATINAVGCAQCRRRG